MLPKDVKLDRLREIVSQHPVFQVTSKLEHLAREYNTLIIWCPKYHCELNLIEGFWCYLKGYVRRNNDQKFQHFFDLICISVQKYQQSGIHAKLWNRFWNCIEMYASGATYLEVLHTLFGAKSSDNVQNHKNVKNFNTNLK